MDNDTKGGHLGHAGLPGALEASASDQSFSFFFLLL